MLQKKSAIRLPSDYLNNFSQKLPSHHFNISNFSIKTAFTSEKKTWKMCCLRKISAARTPNVQAHNDSSVAGDPVASPSGGGLEKRPHLYHWG